MSMLFKLQQLNNCYPAEFRSSSGVYFIKLLRILQLASLLTYCNQFSDPGQLLVTQQVFEILSTVNITTWQSIATNRGIEIVFAVIVGIKFALQLHFIFLAVRSTTLTSERVLIFAHKFVGFIFEELFLVPILIWISFRFVPAYSTSAHNYLPILMSSPTWLLITITTIFAISHLLYMLEKPSDLVFKQLIHDRIRTKSLLFEVIQLTPIVLVILVAQAQIGAISLIWPCAVSIGYTLVIILLEFLDFGHKNPVSRKYSVLFMTALLTHSVYVILIGSPRLQSSFRYLDVIYFFALTFMVKVMQMVCKFAWEPIAPRSSSFRKGNAKSKTFEQIISLYSNKESSSTLEGVLSHQVIISEHLVSCKNSDCFCSPWKQSAKEDPSIFMRKSNEFMLLYYEELLQERLKDKKNELWVLVDFVLLHILDLELPVKACLLLQRYRKEFTARHDKFILQCLASFLERSFIQNLGWNNKDYFQISFIDGLIFDAKYKKMLSKFEEIHEEKSEFYRYLTETNIVDLNKLDQKGRLFMHKAGQFQKDLEESLNSYENVETLSLLIKFKQEMLDQSIRSTRHLQRKLEILYLKKSNKHGLTNMAEESWDCLDADNIFLAIDLVQNIGEILDSSSNLYADLGYREAEIKLTSRAKLTPKTILPRYVYEAVHSEFLAKVKSSKPLEITSNVIKLSFLVDAAGYIIPYEALMKIEFMKQKGLCGAIVLKKIPTQSQYIITRPSGEIISSTRDFLPMLEMESLSNIVGKNICFIIPELFQFFLEMPNRLEDLYPNQNVYSLRFEVAALIEKNILDRSTKTLFNTTEADEVRSLLDLFNSLAPGQALDEKKTAHLNEKFANFTKKVRSQAHSRYQIGLRVQRYNIGNTKFKVLEIFSCSKADSRITDRSTTKVFKNSESNNNTTTNRDSRFLRNLSSLHGKDDDHNNSIENDSNLVPLDGQTAILNFQRKTQDDFKFTIQSAMNPSPYTVTQNLRFELTMRSQDKELVKSSLQFTEEEGKGEVNRETNMSSAKKAYSSRSAKSKSLRDEESNQEGPVTEEREFYEAHQKIEENLPKEDSPENITLKRMSSSGDSDLPKLSSEESKKEIPFKFDLVKAIHQTQNHRFVERAGSISSVTSSTSGSHRSERMKYLIQHNFTYNILRINFVIGVLGVLLILSLFTTQYAGYAVKLNDLSKLCVSMGYPAELASQQQLLVNCYYRWDLYLKKDLLPTSWFVKMITTVNFASYINNCESFVNLLQNAQNVSSAVNSYFAEPQNMVTITYLGYLEGQNETMSLTLALITHQRAGMQYYKDQVQSGKQTTASVQAAYILDQNTNYLYDQMLAMTESLYGEIETRVDDILDFNIILLVVVTITIAILAFCCILMYLRINTKRIRMLALFCTIPKTDLQNEWLKFNHLQKKKDSSKLNSHIIGKMQKQQQSTRRSTEYVYRNNNKWPVLISFMFIFGLFQIPFIFVFTETRSQIQISFQGLGDIKLMVNFGAHYASLITNEFKYFEHINDTSVIRNQIDQTIAQELDTCLTLFTQVQEFLLNYGRLSNQVIYQSTVDGYVSEGLINVCTAINQSAYYTSVCRNISNGIGNQGLIEVLNYFFSISDSTYDQIRNSTNESSTLLTIGKTAVIYDTSMLVIASNRFFRIISDAMTVDMVNYMNEISQQALRDFIGISLTILFVLGAGWVIWIKRMEISLNKTKEIFNVLPMSLLDGSPAIKGYFKQEIRNAGEI